MFAFRFLYLADLEAVSAGFFFLRCLCLHGLPYNPFMSTQPFTELTPDAVLDALDSIGLRSDGRLLALNSYENRVFQAGMEDGPPLVAKFYRPARWRMRRFWKSMPLSLCW